MSSVVVLHGFVENLFLIFDHITFMLNSYSIHISMC